MVFESFLRPESCSCLVKKPGRGGAKTGTFPQTNLILLNPDLRVSSLHSGLPSPSESSFTPESSRSLLLRSSSLRLEDRELRTEDRASQLLSDRLQPLSLLRTNNETEKLDLVLVTTFDLTDVRSGL